MNPKNKVIANTDEDPEEDLTTQPDYQIQFQTEVRSFLKKINKMFIYSEIEKMSPLNQILCCKKLFIQELQMPLQNNPLPETVDFVKYMRLKTNKILKPLVQAASKINITPADLLTIEQ